MVWFRVDDALAFHEKSMIAGNEAMGLWVRAGSYCAQQVNDGIVPTAVVRALGGNEFVADNLVAAGLWHPHEKGYIFHDWEDYQITREQVMNDRAAARDRMAKRRQGGSDEVRANTKAPKTRASRDTVDNSGRAGDNSDAPAESREDVRANNDRTSGEVRGPIPFHTRTSKDVQNTLDDDFERVWASWPRKVSKAASLKAWSRLSAETRARALPLLLEHGVAYAAIPKTYVPHLSTFLNGERWDDELVAPDRGASQNDQNRSVLERYAADGDPE